MITERTRRRFTPEFKKNVTLGTETGYSTAKAAQAVGTSENNLRCWKSELEQEAGGERLNADGRAETTRLHREKRSPVTHSDTVMPLTSWRRALT